jgi:circadian clock protein KaiB
MTRGKKPTAPKPDDEAAKLARTGEAAASSKYLLKLYITGATPKSVRAIENVKRVCEEHLKGRYRLEVVDIYQQPEKARSEDVLAAPTLIKQLPLPLRRLIGDMANTDRILVGLDLRPTT